MSLPLTLARPYAKALFSQAQADGQMSEWLEVLNTASLIIKDARALSFIINPRISTEQSNSLLLDLIQAVQPTLTTSLLEKVDRFLHLLMDEKKIAILPEVAVLYHQLLNEQGGLVEAEIISALPLSDTQRDKIQKKLEKRFHSKITLSVVEDKDLLGGAIIRIGHQVIDGSLRSKWSRLKEGLKF